MRRRRNLMHRGNHQSWLARKILARQPLVTRNARNQLLPQILGFDGEGSEKTGRASYSPAPGFDQGQQIVPPLRGSAFRAPFKEKVEDEPEVSAGPYSPAEIQSRQIIESAEANDFEREVADVFYPAEDVSDQQIVESAEANDFEAELPAPGNKEAVQSGGVNEALRVEIQQKLERAEDSVQPMKARPARGRIEESSAEARHVHPLLQSHASGSAPGNSQVTTVSQSEVALGEKSADDLFTPRDRDRSPQAWMARLLGTGDAAPTQVAFSSAASDIQLEGEQERVKSNVPLENAHPTPGFGIESVIQQPVSMILLAKRKKDIKGESQSPITVSTNNAVRSVTPVSQRTRRFLRPLVGIDPATVNVYQDTIAGRLTDVYQADAITVENDVEMATSHLNDAPETLGLLAHELTHVARQREPHFIPPIARSGGVTPPMDEEALALRVERRVERVAQEQNGQGALIPADLTENASETSASVTNSPYSSRTGRDTWGGLPAPWEPLPGWLVASTSTAESSTLMPAISSQPSYVAHRASGIESNIGQAHGGGNGRTDSIPGSVQRAGRERSDDMEEVQEAQMVTSSQVPAKVPEPDLDALAQQVYAHLKRRLQVERRRES